MPARNSHVWRAAAAVLALPLAIVPAAAQSRQDCRAIRALTNADGRDFADVAIRVTRAPYRVSLRAGGVEALPTPDSCDFSTFTDTVDLNCMWPTVYDTVSAEHYDALFARFSRCLPGMTPPTGPSDYGGATALKRSRSSLPVPGGTVDIDLVLIRSGEEVGSYVSLSISYGAEESD